MNDAIGRTPWTWNFKAGAPRRLLTRMATTSRATSAGDSSAPIGRLHGERSRARARVIAFGTDAPVSPPDPWPGISVASRRADPSWSGALGRALEPAQALGLVAALRAACHGQLLAAGEGLLGGALSSGRRADLVVVPVDALERPVHSGGALASARSRLTLIDGEVVHRDADFDG